VDDVVVVSMVTVPARRHAAVDHRARLPAKCSPVEEYRVSHRGGLGIITIKTTDRNGAVVAVKEVVESDQLMIMTSNGQVIRVRSRASRCWARNTQGVRLINLDEGDKVTDVARVVIEDENGAAVDGDDGRRADTDA